jgi:hypothetical protein
LLENAIAQRSCKRSNVMSANGVNKLVLTIAASVAAFGATAAVSVDAADQGAQRPARIERTHATERARTENGHTRRDEWTNVRGDTVTRDARIVNDSASRSRTRDVVWTGPDGRQATRVDVTQRTADGFARDSTVTLPDARVVRRDADVVRDRAAGTRTREVTTIGPEGRTRSVDDVTQRTDDGYTRSTAVSNPSGSTVTRDVAAAYGTENETWRREVTLEREGSPSE